MKKLISSIALFLATTVSVSVNAFVFPTPDWGALLKEKTNMVKATDFELYVEGDTREAPYYGARLEPRDGIYLGSIPESSEELLPLGAYLTYIEDMYQTDLYYPANTMIQTDNVITVVGYTIHNMGNINYDTVERTLSTLNSYNKPMFIRFANEMNCSELGDDPTLYVDAFRRVADMVHRYPNLAIVWSPNDMGALDRPLEYFYPGDEYVDWIGVSSYCIRYFLGNKNTAYNDTVYFMTGDYAWTTNRLKPVIEFMEKNNIQKPVMISEGGVATNNIYGDNLEAWAAPRLCNMLYNVAMKYPQVKMINYFNTHRANEKERFDISSYPYAIDIFREAAASGMYIREYGKPASFAYIPAKKSSVLTAKDGIINLTTLCYFANTPNTSVNYYLDGVWYSSGDKIPYKCYIDIRGLADGDHTIKIRSGAEERTYWFTKSQNRIRFKGDNGSFSIKVLLDDREIMFDATPVMKNDRTLVPLRAIFEALGAVVEWDQATQTVTSRKGGAEIKMTIGSNVMYKNGEAITLDVAAELISDRTLVPVRAVAESFNCYVGWDGLLQTVLIN